MALGAALRSVEGDLVVLTDANSIPAPGWLSSLREAADRRDGFAVFAGSILPLWDSAAGAGSVAWDEQGLIYALTEPRSDEGPIAPELVWAPNLAVRAEAMACCVGLEGRISRSNPRISAVEVEALVEAICTAGHRVWYVPQAAVRHAPSHRQLQGEWAMRQALRRGRAAATWEFSQRAESPHGYLLAQCLAAGILGKRQFGVWQAHLSGDLQAALRARWRRNHALGRLIECQRQWRYRRTRSATAK